MFHFNLLTWFWDPTSFSWKVLNILKSHLLDIVSMENLGQNVDLASGLPRISRVLLNRFWDVWKYGSFGRIWKLWDLYVLTSLVLDWKGFLCFYVIGNIFLKENCKFLAKLKFSHESHNTCRIHIFYQNHW